MFTTPTDATCVVAEQRGGVASALLEGISRIGDEALTVRARELAGEISAAEANLAAVLAEIERREIHSQWECRNIERFAGWHLQQSPARARGLADVGRAMAELPVMAEAVADGTLSFDKAKSIARVAAPETGPRWSNWRCTRRRRRPSGSVGSGARSRPATTPSPMASRPRVIRR